MWATLMLGIQVIFTPRMILLLCFSTLLGVLFGALPGVSAAMGVTLMLPFSYAMGNAEGVAFLVAVYCAAITGGGITAILFRIPGTSAAAPTTFDGYPLAQKGQAGKALATQLISSSIGGLVAALAMFFLSKQLSNVALKFGTAELFAVAMLGLSILTSLDSEHPIKTLISGFMGLFVATIGIDSLTGTKRLTFGSSYLLGGVSMLPVMIGMFALTEIIGRIVNPIKMEATEGGGSAVKAKLLSFREAWSLKWVWLRQSVIGTLVGILPGAGAAIAAFLGYATELKISKTPEKFGTGCLEGIAAPETANNAATGGSMIPMLALGIPGGSSAAIIASAMVMKGMQLGPLLLVKQPNLLATVFVAMAFVNIFMVFASLGVAKGFSSIIRLPYYALGSIIIMLCMIGCFAIQNNTQNMMLMVVAGAIGLFFVRLGYSPSAFILGLVLGSICEVNLRRAVLVHYGKYMDVFSRPLTAVLLIISVLLAVIPIALPKLRKKLNLSGKKKPGDKS